MKSLSRIFDLIRSDTLYPNGREDEHVRNASLAGDVDSSPGESNNVRTADRLDVLLGMVSAAADPLGNTTGSLDCDKVPCP